MITRRMYRGFFKPEYNEKIITSVKKLVPQLQKMIQQEKIITLSIFMWKDNLFLYYEDICGEIYPNIFLKDLQEYLINIPGQNQKFWTSMLDVFHYSKPIDKKGWERKIKKESFARLNRLKPEKYSSYIYYHYQYQEEYPGDGNKYGLIGINDNLMFFYSEDPLEQEEAPYRGQLNTRNTPRNTWLKLMREHFLAWEDTDEDWIKIEKIIQV